MSTLTQVYKEQFDNYINEIGCNRKRQTLTLTANFYSAITSTFRWKKLPSKIPYFFPEKWLFFNGLMAGYIENGEFHMLPAFGNGQITEYGLFDSYTLINARGQNIIKGIEEIELCFNNTLAYPSVFIMNEIVDKCDNALTAVDNTLRRAAFSRIIECKTPEQQSLIKGILSGSANIDNRLAIVTLSNALKSGEINVHALFDNNADDVLAQWDIFARYRNMGYTTFGFDTVEIQKKERLTQAEGSANSEISRYSLFIDMFDCRRDYCERVKDRFGYELEVDVNRNSNTVYNVQLDNEEKIDNELVEISKGSNLGLDYDGEEVKKNDEENKSE